LRVHPGEAIDEAGYEELPGAVDDVRAFGDWDIGGRAYVCDVAVADDHDGVGKIAGRVAPVGYIDDSAAGEDELRKAGGGGDWGRGCLL
jgi:hypothetical protein